MIPRKTENFEKIYSNLRHVIVMIVVLFQQLFDKNFKIYSL